MDRRQLEIKRLVERLGYEVRALVRAKNGHFRVTVGQGDQQVFVTFPCSASDNRWMKNKKSEIKHLFTCLNESPRA